MTQVACKAAAAFVAGNEMRLANNTRVGPNYVGYQSLYLHGHQIAWRDDGGNVFMCMCGWATTTTKNRLNALCDVLGIEERFWTKKREPYFGDRAIMRNEVVPANLGPLHRMIHALEHNQPLESVL